MIIKIYVRAQSKIIAFVTYLYPTHHFSTEISVMIYILVFFCTKSNYLHEKQKNQHFSKTAIIYSNKNAERLSYSLNFWLIQNRLTCADPEGWTGGPDPP